MKAEFLAVLVTILLAPCLAVAGSNPWDRNLPFKEAAITYAISGMETGQEFFYIRDHGKKMARHRSVSTTMLGVTQKMATIEITDPDWVYSFDLREHTGTKSVNPQKIMIEEYDKLSAVEKKKVNENAEKMAGGFMGAVQGAVEPNVKEIHGYSCDKVSAMGSTIYAIHGTSISLLSESSIMGITVKSEAIEVKEEGADEKYFQFPQGIVPQPNAEADQMARMMAEQMIAGLKDPEGFKKKSQGILGLPSGGQPEIPKEDQMQMEEAMNTLKQLLGK